MRRTLPLVVVLASLALASSAHAGELRFSITAKGGVVSTGNTLGLAKQSAANGPGTSDSIGTFLSLDPNLVDLVPANVGNPWFAGTTSDWTLDGSAALLALPQVSAGIEVVYAELVWGGSYLYGTENVSASLDVPVTLAAEGDELDAVPDPATAVTLSEVALGGFAVNYYMRSAVVTDFVAEHLGTTYSVSGVPATQDFAIDQLNAAGWTLVVVYRSSEAPTRNLTVFVGGQFVDEDSSEDYPVAGFCTPPQGTVEGAVLISALEGDANRTGDSFEIAETIADVFVPLEGPNNPVDNFFASQINGPSGELDTLGTLGDANHDAFAGVNASGGRQGWDSTKVPVSSSLGQLSAGQTSAVLRAVTSGDSFMPVLAAFEIDVSSPDFESNEAIATTPDAIALGEQSTITLELFNAGEVAASELVLTAPLGQGLALVEFAIDGVVGDVDQAPVTTADLVTGVAIGDVAAAEAHTITMIVEAVGEPASPQGWSIPVGWTYDYVSCVGEDPLTEQSIAFAQLGFVAGGESEGSGGTADAGESAGTSESGEGGRAEGGEGGSGGESDGTSLGNDEVGLDDLGDGSRGSDGCDCTSGEPGGAAPFGVGLLVLAAVRTRRRSAVAR